MRENLLTKTVETLEEFNFDILVYLHSCLDIAAQKKALILLVKVLENIDGFKEKQAEELRKLSFVFKASPLLIGESTKTFRLEDGIIYDRHAVPAVTLETFRNSLTGAYPEKIFSKGRVIAELNGEELKKIREKKNITAEDLAEEIKLTRESIYLYEKEKIRVKYELAKRIESFLNAELIKKPSFLEPVKEKISEVGGNRAGLREKLLLFDFDVTSFNKLNFDIIAKDLKNKVVIKEELTRNPEKIFDFSDFFKTFLAFVTEEKKPDIPVIRKEELEDIESKKDFIKLLKERSKSYT